MSDEFFTSLGHIRSESMSMLKNLKAVRGESYARLVHSIILADQIDQVSQTVGEISKEPILTTALSNMIAKIMDNYMRSSTFNDEELKEAMQDAVRIMNMTYELVDKASALAKQGHVMGANDAA